MTPRALLEEAGVIWTRRERRRLALVDDNASARRSWLGGQWTEDGGVTEAPGDGVELRSVTLAVEVRYSAASEGGDGGGE